MKRLFLLLILSMLLSTTNAIGCAICIASYNAAVVACYASAGLVIGTITLGVGAPQVAVACSAAQGVCMAACAAGGVATAGICSIL